MISLRNESAGGRLRFEESDANMPMLHPHEAAASLEAVGADNENKFARNTDWAFYFQHRTVISQVTHRTIDRGATERDRTSFECAMTLNCAISAHRKPSSEEAVVPFAAVLPDSTFGKRSE